jgi:hypothetical protein
MGRRSITIYGLYFPPPIIIITYLL